MKDERSGLWTYAEVVYLLSMWAKKLVQTKTQSKLFRIVSFTLIASPHLPTLNQTLIWGFFLSKPCKHRYPTWATSKRRHWKKSDLGKQSE